jgi:hypothetical protein
MTTNERDAVDFWQLVQDTAYLMEGENRAYERERMKLLAEALGAWLAAHPEITESGSLDHFAMYSVHRLVNAFVFNDTHGTDQPDFKERLFDSIVANVGGPDRFAATINDESDDPQKH